jgi:hypothetical protein
MAYSWQADEARVDYTRVERTRTCLGTVERKTDVSAVFNLEAMYFGKPALVFAGQFYNDITDGSWEPTRFENIRFFLKDRNDDEWWGLPITSVANELLAWRLHEDEMLTPG